MKKFNKFWLVYVGCTAPIFIGRSNTPGIIDAVNEFGAE
jgi:hypothetical protein